MHHVIRLITIKARNVLLINVVLSDLATDHDLSNLNPFGSWIPSSEIKIPVQFKIEESGTVKIILDFEADKSIGVTKNKKKSIYKLRPVIKVENISYS